MDGIRIPTGETAGVRLTLAAKDYVDRHYMEKFSLEKMAGELYVNGSYLLRVFKAHTGKTLLWYHNRVRCEHAQELLRKKGMSITDIAAAAGFVTTSHFSHVFKRMTGVSPKRYREQCIRHNV